MEQRNALSRNKTASVTEKKDGAQIIVVFVNDVFESKKQRRKKNRKNECSAQSKLFPPEYKKII